MGEIVSLQTYRKRREIRAGLRTCAFGGAMKWARAIARVPQADAAEVGGCDISTLSRYENDRLAVPWNVLLPLAVHYERRKSGAGRWLLRQHPAVQQWIALGGLQEFIDARSPDGGGSSARAAV